MELTDWKEAALLNSVRVFLQQHQENGHPLKEFMDEGDVIFTFQTMLGIITSANGYIYLVEALEDVDITLYPRYTQERRATHVVAAFTSKTSMLAWVGSGDLDVDVRISRIPNGVVKGAPREVQETLFYRGKEWS